ncbi:MAG TPA: hypothetical protein VGD45_20575 [Steroidobacter sp.]|uniref:hypothetical protein n=1 Tax=Steroidobacter sp. TaxID=1978227 RepID=UPI002ED84C34
MNPSKAWALLTARGVQIGGVGGGGIPNLLPSDIARMLDGLERGPFLAGMVRESGDAQSIGPLERWLYVETLLLADPRDAQGRPIKRLRWPDNHGQAYCRRLAGLAVFEFVAPRPLICPDCKGQGWKRAHGNGTACPTCKPEMPDLRITMRKSYDPGDEPGGTGYISLTPAARADLAGIPLKSWNDGWDERYEQVHTLVTGWHATALAHLRRALLEYRAIA